VIGLIRVSPEVSDAFERGLPVVALESALITHGFAPPSNLSIARQMVAAVRDEGGVPATIAVIDGQARVGLSDEELARLASETAARKVSVRDLPIALAQGTSGGTTVAATMILAHHAGLRVFATGGIGGVHRGHPEDVSADLPALASTPLIVVCAGAKAILDLPRTLQYLETHGVPVIGYGTGEFPAFYSRHSGLPVDGRVDKPEEIVRIARERTALGLSAALLVCVPIREGDDLPSQEVEAATRQAVAAAEAAGAAGHALTPFLLDAMVKLTGGRAQRANESLLINNARIAVRIARAMGAGDGPVSS
jgi:pseudouridine-5'-phosphate glycosidase